MGVRQARLGRGKAGKGGVGRWVGLGVSAWLVNLSPGSNKLS